MPLEQVEPFMDTLCALRPNPTTELVYANLFELLVSVVLSAQATDKSVNAATPALFKAAPTPEAMVALGEEGIGPFIRSIGLWRGKARNLAALSAQLLEKHGGQVPEDRKALEALPGVGRKTANVVLNTGFGHLTMGVDTHIFRVANRTGLAPGNTVDDVEQGLLARLPEHHLRDAHHQLLLHGRYTCKARTPECWQCPVARFCRYSAKTPAPAKLPSGTSAGEVLPKTASPTRL
ncbi:endonuclease III [Formicincola oecophyllae]|uniref:Endonuclease III n=2 Tax=Formicincola oecophyllae TaxID=2558361 RepID=A0A4Y6U8M6_9PROT|nr:endonuclease III [Formicincola oecophyllae]QDH13722.1 endonuclease III [Formicincola oecophyllae]